MQQQPPMTDLTLEQLDAMTDEQVIALNLPERRLADLAKYRWQQSLQSMPANLRALAERLPAINDAGDANCYRLRDRPHCHLVITSYDEDLTLTILEGADSRLAGVGAFHIDPDRLTPCGCGRWEQASQAQAEQTRAKFELIRAVMGDDALAEAAARDHRQNHDPEEPDASELGPRTRLEDLSPERRAELQSMNLKLWLDLVANMPPHVQALAQAMPCIDETGSLVSYRDRERPERHYVITAYDHSLTLSLEHLADSTSPGEIVTSVQPSTIVREGKDPVLAGAQPLGFHVTGFDPRDPVPRNQGVSTHDAAGHDRVPAMSLKMRPTDQLVQVATNRPPQGRIWEGTTEEGVPFAAVIVAVTFRNPELVTFAQTLKPPTDDTYALLGVEADPDTSVIA